jgi:predicted NAD-dependent protein-ADP-ribosyltransferase YbiA (DUF1768 family)
VRVLLKDGDVVVVLDEHSDLQSMLDAWTGHAFRAHRSGGALVFRHLGEYDDVFRVPINVTSRHRDPAVRLISNFAETPFELDGTRYASVEGFWQSLRAPVDARAAVACLAGARAKEAGRAFAPPDVIAFRGRTIAWGSPESWDLMRVACRAKFTLCVAAGDALLSTAPRPLTHRTRNDSRSIPDAIMAGIWMQLRDELIVARRGGRSGVTPGIASPSS